MTSSLACLLVQAAAGDDGPPRLPVAPLPTYLIAPTACYPLSSLVHSGTAHLQPPVIDWSDRVL